jgi:hypothetical protein
MSARLVGAALAAAAVLLDGAGAHELAGLVLVAAVPAAGIAALQALADAIVESRLAEQLQVVPAAAALVLIVAAAALRAPLAGAEDPPSAAGLAVAGALAAFALQALVGGVAVVRRQPHVRVSPERLAQWRP